MPQFRKKPVVIEAVQLTRPMTVETLEGTMSGNPGDWLITGVAGEQYFCKDAIFKATYQEVVKPIIPRPVGEPKVMEEALTNAEPDSWFRRLFR